MRRVGRHAVRRHHLRALSTNDFGLATLFCTAVQDGKVVSVTMTSAPRSSIINACVRRAVARLRFPKNVRLDIARTRFDATR